MRERGIFDDFYAWDPDVEDARLAAGQEVNEALSDFLQRVYDTVEGSEPSATVIKMPEASILMV